MIKHDLSKERDRLLDLWLGAGGEERAKILGRLVVIDEELEADDVRVLGNIFENLELLEGYK